MDRHLLLPGFENVEAAPNSEHLRDTLLRRAKPGRVPFMELFHDDEIAAEILGRPMSEFSDWAELRLRLGYDHVPLRISPDFRRAYTALEDTAHISRGQRNWATAGGGFIKNREDFERYQWPDVDFELPRRIEDAADLLPEGMCITLRSSGILDNLMRIMGYEGMSEAMYDDPELIRDVADRVGEAIYLSHRACLGREEVFGTFFGDDMGFKTSTMISPEHIREYVLPWHKNLADLFHEHNKLFILHACGQVDAVMNDLIEFVGIDAKHSFEDAIEPVASIKKKYGDRIGIIGGVDMDVLARSTPDQVATYTRKVLDDCAPNGGYALGSGNSIANYIPIPNYFAMLREGRRWNGENG